jgi:hypothetical protein
VTERLEIAIAYEAVPGLPPSPFHMMMSRHTPYAEELLAVLNEGITEISAKDGTSAWWRNMRFSG